MITYRGSVQAPEPHTKGADDARVCHLHWNGRSQGFDLDRRRSGEIDFEHSAAKATFQDYMQAVRQHNERVAELVQQLEASANTEPYRDQVGWLRCFRGIDTVTAMTLLAEVCDFRRFGSARQLMAYLGLTPSEMSSGSKTQRGGISKTGNSHARRALIEAAWHCRHRPAVSAKLRKRRRDQPKSVIALADKAQRRLYRRYWHLIQLGKASPKVVTAIARELVGFIWALLAGPGSEEHMKTA